MVDEARADNRENDVEYLKPSSRSTCASLPLLTGGCFALDVHFPLTIL